MANNYNCFETALLVTSPLGLNFNEFALPFGFCEKYFLYEVVVRQILYTRASALRAFFSLIAFRAAIVEDKNHRTFVFWEWSCIFMQIIPRYCSRLAICAKLLTHSMLFVKNYFLQSPLKALTMMNAGLLSSNRHSVLKWNNGRLKTIIIIYTIQ